MLSSSARRDAEEVGYFSHDSASKSLPEPFVFEKESKNYEIFSSTLPTSPGASKLKVESQINNLIDLDLGVSRDSDTIYPIESTPEGLEYIRLFANRLIGDLREEHGILNVLDIPSSFINDAVGAFAGRLHQESTNSFQWGASAVLHRKRQ